MIHSRYLLAGALVLAAAACGVEPAIELPPAGFPSAVGVEHLAGTPITVEDAIRMVRIEDYYGYNERFVAFSPDGSKFAVVVWHGDVERDVNVFSLLAFDTKEALANPGRRPKPALSIPFAGDTLDQAATPIGELTFLGDNRTVTFLGTLRGEPRQVYAVDIETGKVRALTNHPTAVKAYAAANTGAVRLYAATAPDDADSARTNRFRDDGVFPYDRAVLPDVLPHLIAPFTIMGSEAGEVRQYLIPAPRHGGEPRLVFDSRQSRRTQRSVWEIASDTATGAVPRGSLASESMLSGLSSFAVGPTGRYAVMWPYILGEHSIDSLPHAAWNTTNLFGRSLAAYFGLVDLETGEIRPLLDQLYVPFLADTQGQVWSPDGRSLLVKTLLPLDSKDDAENAKRAAAPPVWLEVQVPSREYARVEIPEAWSIIRWGAEGDLVLRRADSLAVMRKTEGVWGSPEPIGTIQGFNRRHPAVTNGRVVIGIRDSLTVAPELAAYDLATGETVVLTDLNPHLRDRRYGEVERIQFPTQYDSVSYGWLIKPVDYQPGKRYPLVVLQKDEGERPWDTSYLIDGNFNLSGHAIQPLAAAGFMVLFIGESESIRPHMETADEGPRVVENIESAIRTLAARGLVDSTRVGISGWSRAAYYTDYLLIHSKFRYAAASQIDGGAAEYNDRMRPFTDAELSRIRTPLLMEPHGRLSLTHMGAMGDRLKAMGKPVEILYFHTAPHSTKQPQHRKRSLEVHVDWWRFWLQDYEDPTPEKSAQYERWRSLKAPTLLATVAGRAE